MTVGRVPLRRYDSSLRERRSLRVDVRRRGSDCERGFIVAGTVSLADFLASGGLKEARDEVT